jgi:hypothetical protein
MLYIFWPILIAILASHVSNLILVRLPREFGAKVGEGNLYASYLLTMVLVVFALYITLAIMGSGKSDSEGIIYGLLMFYGAPVAIVLGIVFAVKLGKQQMR